MARFLAPVHTSMRNRGENHVKSQAFPKNRGGGATAGLAMGGRGFANAGLPVPQNAPGKRREVFIDGRRVKVIDIHAHGNVPGVWEAVKDTKLASSFGNRANGPIVMGPDRLRSLDERGIDIQVLSNNAYWLYGADRDLASKVVKVHNESMSEWCKAHPDRYAALALVALQFPDLAAAQLEYGVKQLGLRGAAIGGRVEGEVLSNPRFDPFWAKVQELDVVVFTHPQNAENVIVKDGLSGKGDLGNIIGNPLETTIALSHLIFEGTLDRFPGLKIIAAHGGGYLPSYLGRTEVACKVRPAANCANKKLPSEYLKKQIFVDSILNTEENLRHVIAEVGPSQVVYGTDEPFEWPLLLDMILNASFLNAREKEAILGGNLIKLLRI